MKIYKTLIYTAIFVIVVFSVIFSFMFQNNNPIVTSVLSKKRILLLAQVYQNPYWQIIKKGAQDAANNRGCVIEYDGPQTPNINESLKIFDMGIAANMDGIITYVQEDKKYIPLINKAVNNGTPVITIDADAKQSSRMAFVGTNNIEAGNTAGQQLMEITLTKAKIGIIMAGKTTTSQVERVKGFKDYISGHSGISIVATASSNSDIIESELVARKMIEEHPEMDSLFCTNSVDGIGAARAVLDSNKKGKIIIVCFDDLPETLNYIKQDVIQASIVQKPYQMGYDSVNLMMDKLDGKKVNGEFFLGIIAVTKQNVYNYNIEKGVIN